MFDLLYYATLWPNFYKTDTEDISGTNAVWLARTPLYIFLFALFYFALELSGISISIFGENRRRATLLGFLLFLVADKMEERIINRKESIHKRYKDKITSQKQCRIIILSYMLFSLLLYALAATYYEHLWSFASLRELF